MVAEDSYVLLQDLVDTFGLAIQLRMECGGLVAVNVAKFE